MNPSEHLLEQVFGLVTMTGHAQQITVKARAVTAHERIEGREIAGDVRGD